MVPTGGRTFFREESVGCLVQLCIMSTPEKLLGAERRLADASSLPPLRRCLSLLGDDDVSKSDIDVIRKRGTLEVPW